MKAASVALLFLPLFPSVSRSQSPFDGTWVIDTSKNENLANEKPTTFLLSAGVFRSPDKVLKANGRDQKVPATGYWDTVSVRIVDDHTVEVTSKGWETDVHGDRYSFSGRQYSDSSGKGHHRNGGRHLRESVHTRSTGTSKCTRFIGKVESL